MSNAVLQAETRPEVDELLTDCIRKIEAASSCMRALSEENDMRSTSAILRLLGDWERRAIERYLKQSEASALDSDAIIEATATFRRTALKKS